MGIPIPEPGQVHGLTHKCETILNKLTKDTHTQTDTHRQTDTQTHRQTHTHTNTHTHKHTHTQTHTHTHTQTLMVDYRLKVFLH